MKLFLSAGEPSGDLHGANLIRALHAQQPNASIIGFGGPKMAAAGCLLSYPLTDLAVMGLQRVLRHIPTFFHLADVADRCFRTERPDAVVLIDYPGFNFVLAQKAHARGIPVYYFVPPQLWAWRRGRVRQVRKWCAGVLTALPFEEDWYRDRRVRTEYVGHPYFDELRQQQLDPAFLAEQRTRGGRIVGVLPGSRHQEVTMNFEMMLAAAEKVAREQPDSRFLVAAFNEKLAGVARAMIARTGSRLAIEVHTGRTPEIIELSDCCMAVSGSVSLEIMCRAKPTTIVYRMKPFSLWLARRLVKLPYFTLVNLLAQEELFPEIATARDESSRVAHHITKWLGDDECRAATVAKLEALRARVAVPGACERAAAFLVSELGQRGGVSKAA
jgi:lipid-A-disaccharide synthase